MPQIENFYPNKRFSFSADWKKTFFFNAMKKILAKLVGSIKIRYITVIMKFKFDENIKNDEGLNSGICPQRTSDVQSCEVMAAPI